MLFTTSICTQGEVPVEGANEACRPMCAAVHAFIDQTFSQQANEYSCNDVRLVEALGGIGRKEECGLTCPSIACTPRNIDRKSVV